LKYTKNFDQDIERNPLSNEYPGSWLLIADSAYVGASRYLRAVTMKKRGSIPRSQQQYYNNLSRDRVICENFYGRLVNLFGVMRHVYRYEHVAYDDIFVVCCMLTNFHILCGNPLRENDGQYYRKILQDRVEKVDTRALKRAECSRKYQQKLKAKRTRTNDASMD